MTKGPFKITIFKSSKSFTNTQDLFFVCITWQSKPTTESRFSKSFDTYLEAAMLMQAFVADNSTLYTDFKKLTQLLTVNSQIVAAFKLTGKTLKTLN